MADYLPSMLDPGQHTGRVISCFTAAERRRGMTAATVAKRASMARRWIHYVDDAFDCTWHDVEAFIDDSDMDANASKYAATSHLHQFYLWAMRQGLTDHDPTALVVRPRLTPGLPRPAHDTDLALAIVVTENPVRAAIIVAATCGLRCVELARLRWSDVGVDSMRVTGKGGRDRVVPVHAEAAKALEQLDRVDDYVFPWRVDAGIAPGRRASHAINGTFRQLGLSTTAHQLRHWCGTQALAASGDLRAVQDLLGHASPATTAIYTRLDATRLRDVTNAIALPT